jgi:hypothetical protein
VLESSLGARGVERAGIEGQLVGVASDERDLAVLGLAVRSGSLQERGAGVQPDDFSVGAHQT